MRQYLIYDNNERSWVKFHEENGVKSYSYTDSKNDAYVLIDPDGWRYINDQPWHLYTEYGLDWYNDNIQLHEIFGEYDEDSWDSWGSWDD